ncbi:unnamed protein product [Phytophthora fragariaefolia]|uniref:Unnamed protein product n=1 Tax=Phytophthora fragariaefolia TaxID=1490495 RepID=A0A9W6UAX1_9STRA|nr:unnamed protein product [Phytophthora fragariaefolia]
MKSEAEELKQLVTEGADALSAKSKEERFDEQSWDSLKLSPLYEVEVLRGYKDVLPDDIPGELPQDQGVQHEIDLVPGMNRRKDGQLRESKSPHNTPTFCVKNAQGGWHIVHANNKLNDATVPAQTPIPRNDVIIDSMTLGTIFSALDLRVRFYQILMRESDIPVTALKPAERNYPVRNKELRAMKYALANFRVYLLGSRPFVVNTDHASLRTEIKSPHISQRMAVWLSIFAEYNFRVKYKPGSLNVVAVALPRRPHYAVPKDDANCHRMDVSSLVVFVRRSEVHIRERCEYEAVVGLPSDKSRQKLAKHLRVRVHRYRVHNGLLLYSAVDDNAGRVVVPDDHKLRLRITFEYRDAPTSGHPGRETTHFSRVTSTGVTSTTGYEKRFEILGTQLSMSTSDHQHTDRQTEHVNRVPVDALKSCAHSFHHWSDCLPMVEFAINNSVHVSAGHTPFYVNAMRHPRVTNVPRCGSPSLKWGRVQVSSKPNEHADTSKISAVSTRAQAARSAIDESVVSRPGVDTLDTNEKLIQAGPVLNKDAKLNMEFSSKAMDIVQRRLAVIRFLQDALAAAVNPQKLDADNNGSGNTNEFKVG